MVPVPEYGKRLLRIAHELLVPGGLAIFKIKYREERRAMRRRRHRPQLADTMVFSIRSFWESAGASGFEPQSIELVPENDLDERCAYFVLAR